jgi:hypothetical protein
MLNDHGITYPATYTVIIITIIIIIIIWAVTQE